MYQSAFRFPYSLRRVPAYRYIWNDMDLFMTKKNIRGGV